MRHDRRETEPGDDSQFRKRPARNDRGVYNSSMLDPEACYSALTAHDRRFDGRFYTAVTTTGVYCRPVCRAPLPQRRHVRFFACAAAAEEAGFRPCRRCRPEAAPGSPAWAGTSATVSRADRKSTRLNSSH